MTLLEVLVVMAAVAILVATYFATRPKQAYRILRIQCVNNLKQIGLAYRVWEGDNGFNYPMSIPGTNGGTLEFTTGPNAWRHYQMMSNELSTPLVLLCPEDSDRARFRAAGFNGLSNSNLSFFVGVDANETNPAAILSGDHNITNGTPLKNAMLELTTNNLAGWTAETHHKRGNIGLADGSVMQTSNAELRIAVANTGWVTNRLQMPVLGP